MRAFIIESITDCDEETGQPLVWSNTEGFTSSDNFDTFTEDERNTLRLPLGGVWIEVPWRAE